MEQFNTLQGEGFHQGRPAHFIRLGGCNVGCVWCDVKESWEAGKHPNKSILQIVNKAEDARNELVVVTGGEPMEYECSPLTKALKEKGFELALESSGAYALNGQWDWVCISPKKFKAPLDSALEQANELKVVVYNKSDFEWAENHKAKVPPDCKLYLQPEWSKVEEMKPLIIDYMVKHPEWKLSTQLHKYLGLP